MGSEAENGDVESAKGGKDLFEPVLDNSDSAPNGDGSSGELPAC